MSYIQKKFPEIITFIHQRFSDLRGDEKIGEIYFRIIETLPKCKVCGKSLKFNSGKQSYPKQFCSKACEHSPLGEKLKFEVTKQTKLKNHGDPYYSNYEKARQTCIKKYGVAHALKNPKIKDKQQKSYIQTCLSKYGVDNAAKLDFVQDKMKQTCLERFGVDNVFKSQEIQDKKKSTCLERYGVDNPTKSDIIK